MTQSATLTDRPDDRALCKQAGTVIIPTLEYPQSLEATPISSIRTSSPPAGLQLATVIVLDVPDRTCVKITYQNE
jgi:hypothetical protein